MVDRVTNSTVGYQVQSNDDLTNLLIAGYEVIRFGVPMRVRYVNTGRGRRVTIRPAIPGAQYKITAWALRSSRNRSAIPAVVYATTGETSECDIRTYMYNPNVVYMYMRFFTANYYNYSIIYTEFVNHKTIIIILYTTLSAVWASVSNPYPLQIQLQQS